MYVTVETEKGTLRGQEKTSEFFSCKKYFSFQGIPYAKPPLGQLRFKDPEEPEAWSGVRDALKEGNDCSQIHLLDQASFGSEDCLYLNVYTPQVNAQGLPVMVWIHGGGFTSGSGSSELHGPDYLMEQDVVLVTINYRLGVLGFLCLDHEEVPGNAGLKDQTMALRWVQKNIIKFGGDPNNVTIFGVSAGGASVHYHVLSPLSQGLFHRAIIQSGTALNHWALNIRDNAIDRAFRLGKALGCDTKDINKLLQFLREVSVNDFLTTVNSILTEDEVLHGVPLPFVPCVEVPATSQSFLPLSPRELLKLGRFTKIPIIIGSSSNEGVVSLMGYKLTEETIGKEAERFHKFILQDMGLSPDSENGKQILKEIKQFYFENLPVTMENVGSFLDLIGDVLFDVGIDESVRLMVETTEPAPTYDYGFTHCLINSYNSMMAETMNLSSALKDACHGVDLSFFFSHTLKGIKKPTYEDEQFIAKMTKMWATFAKTGNPNYEGIETKWEPVNKNRYCHLDIGKEFELVAELFKHHRVQMWQKMYEKHPHVI